MADCQYGVCEGNKNVFPLLLNKHKINTSQRWQRLNTVRDLMIDLSVGLAALRKDNRRCFRNTHFVGEFFQGWRGIFFFFFYINVSEMWYENYAVSPLAKSGNRCNLGAGQRRTFYTLHLNASSFLGCFCNILHAIVYQSASHLEAWRDAAILTDGRGDWGWMRREVFCVCACAWMWESSTRRLAFAARDGKLTRRTSCLDMIRAGGVRRCPRYSCAAVQHWSGVKRNVFMESYELENIDMSWRQNQSEDDTSTTKNLRWKGLIIFCIRCQLVGNWV